MCLFKLIRVWPCFVLAYPGGPPPFRGPPPAGPPPQGPPPRGFLEERPPFANYQGSGPAPPRYGGPPPPWDRR